MASGAVWGIDIGQCALKALRCRVHENPKKVVAEAFDYIEYPKILSQPGSDPAELVGDALKQFLSRNSVLGDRVAVSVSGQAGLARFIKLPPVETKKIPDIVRYEAKQQIPFDLNDVVWDYQRMGGGAVEEGFALETEIGLFAMKRDAVFRALDPFLKLDIEVDVVQLAPLVLYNFLVFDQMPNLPPPEEFDPENPPESVVIVSMGTDATDLVITNGFRVWQRSIPIGGSHFTKALTRELKLTFAKAEHLKRNATAAADPKAVFQAMKPTFSDLLTELQRSIGYFSNLDRAAKIGRVVALGNAMKLPGLRRYLSQSLGYEIEKIESFQGLVGPQVVAAPAFQENLLSFGISYGLAVQGLGKGAVHTNLLPREIINDRLVKRKKPWAVAAAALLLLGCGISYTAYSMSLGGVDAAVWKSAQDQAKALNTKASGFKTEDAAARAEFETTNQIGQHLVGNVDGRIRWLELLAAINTCLPRDLPPKADEEPPPIENRNELHITNLDCQYTDEVAGWYTLVSKDDELSKAAATAVGNAAAAPAAPTPLNPDAPPPEGNAASDSSMPGPKGPGWIVQLSGYHYHNADRVNMGPNYVRTTLLKGLAEGTVELPSGEGGAKETVKLKDLGVSYPILVNPTANFDEEIPDPNAEDSAGGGGMMQGGGAAVRVRPQGAAANTATNANTIKLSRFNFTVHFCWQPQTPTARHAPKKTPEEQAKAAADAAAP